MKNLLLLIFIVIFGNLFSQIEPSSCESNDSIKDLFRESAAQLSVRRIYENNSSETVNVMLNQNIVDSILSAMIAIYNVQNIPERDTVIDYYQITSKGPGVNMVYVLPDTTKSWVDNWANLITFTGDSLMDTILTRYHLTLDNYSTFSGIAAFTSDLYLNIEALADTLQMHPDVYLAGQNQMYLDGPDIYYSTDLDTQIVTYKYAWGDCMSGCMYRHCWEFKVYSDCSVEFVRSYNPDLVSISEIECCNNIDIYPNPNNGDFKIKGDHIEKIELFNILGKKIETILISEGQDKIISTKQKGTYFVKIFTKKGSVTKKVIIE